ncbi:MAG: tRNA (N6-isopentenyl adenosine(37)-C2)-methylthiotransferase MiaB [Actinomycetia bacterium]|nr:tRNA (N6-isopentenyl adenosine(37)-C2)-methylthiotransferase MiaB [Actinomycetes bacterium]MCP4962577.1 tRNA (N6-isopentenyl adenosine(37)-C2)-methylthiotransferase MiaB [Actinomycetes bacterium]
MVRTFGCQMNEHDSERIAGLLEQDGLESTDELDDADVIVLNTCCIRENADNKLYGHLGHLKRLKEKRPDLQIAVGGCLAQKDRDLIQQRAGHVDVVFGTHNVRRAVDLLNESRISGPVTEIVEESDEFPSALPVHREAGHAAWVTIQIGCDNNCAFCIVPSVRGVEISRSFGELVDEVAVLAADGITEVTLLGQNVNSYGRDLTLTNRGVEIDDLVRHTTGSNWADGDRRARPLFADLLRAVGDIEGIKRVRYTSPHPKDLRPETIAAMAEVPTVCEHLHLPLQSGSDAVLSAMHRGYTADRYLEKLAHARATVDDLAVTTDIIVGFPGETDADFEATLEVAAASEYDSAYTFMFSPRPGTEAADMVGRHVDPAVISARFERLRVVIERSGRARHLARVGRIEEVVVEGLSKRDQSMTTGRTRQNKLVHFAAPKPLRVGTYANVEVTDAFAHSLKGRFVEIIAPATHRTHIPVVGL